MNDHRYTYTAVVRDVYDGDTITCDISMGLGVWKMRQKLRLLGIDTPELRGSERLEGLKVRNYVRDAIMDRTVLIKTHRDRTGKFGRWLATVYYGDQLINLNEELIHLGYAKPYN